MVVRLNRPSFLTGIRVTGPNHYAQGIESYQITWHRAFFETPTDGKGHLQTWLRRQAWFGTGSLFFSYLRRQFPKAFVLSNFASLPERARSLPDIAGLNLLNVLSTYTRIAVKWDYGFGGRGAPISGVEANLIEIADHNQVLTALMGLAPVELSFALILGEREMRLTDLGQLMDTAGDPNEWEVKVLSAAGLLGFPHEEAMYTIKTRNPEAKLLLSELQSSGLTSSEALRNE